MTIGTQEKEDKEKKESEILSPKPEGGSSGDSETESPGDSGSPQDPKDEHDDDEDDDGELSPETKKLILDKINEQKDMPKKRGPGRPPKIKKEESTGTEKSGGDHVKDSEPAPEKKSCYNIVNALYYSTCSFLKVKYDDVESKALAEVWQPVYDDFKPDKKEDKILFAVIVTAAVIGSKVMDKKKQGGINADEKENKKASQMKPVKKETKMLSQPNVQDSQKKISFEKRKGIFKIRCKASSGSLTTSSVGYVDFYADFEKLNNSVPGILTFLDHRTGNLVSIKKDTVESVEKA